MVHSTMEYYSADKKITQWVIKTGTDTAYY